MEAYYAVLSAEISAVLTSYVIHFSLLSFSSPSSLYGPVFLSLFMMHKQARHKSLPENKGHESK